MNTIAWALLVDSSDAQADILKHQRSWAEKTASDKGWYLTKVLEGVSSGRDGPRTLGHATSSSPSARRTRAPAPAMC